MTNSVVSKEKTVSMKDCCVTPEPKASKSVCVTPPQRGDADSCRAMSGKKSEMEGISETENVGSSLALSLRHKWKSYMLYTLVFYYLIAVVGVHCHVWNTFHQFIWTTLPGIVQLSCSFMVSWFPESDTLVYIQEVFSLCLHGSSELLADFLVLLVEPGEHSWLTWGRLEIISYITVWWLMASITSMVVSVVCYLMYTMYIWATRLGRLCSEQWYCYRTRQTDWKGRLMLLLPGYHAYLWYQRMTHSKVMRVSMITCGNVSVAESNASGLSKPRVVKEMAIQGCPQRDLDAWPDGAGVLLDSNFRPLGFVSYVSDPALRSGANPFGECLRYTAHQQKGANAVGGKVSVLGPAGRRTELFVPFLLRSIAGFNGDVVSVAAPKNLGALTGIKRAVMRKFAAGQKPIRVLSLPAEGSVKLRCSTSDANAVGLKITYKASTSPGSSGSPIYQGNFVVGTHVQSCVDASRGVFQNEGALWFSKPIGYVTRTKETFFDNGEGYSETDHIDGKPDGRFRDTYYDESEKSLVRIEYDAKKALIAIAKDKALAKFIADKAVAGALWSDWDDEEEESAEEKRLRRAREDDLEEQNRMQDEEESKNSRWRIKEATNPVDSTDSTQEAVGKPKGEALPQVVVEDETPEMVSSPPRTKRASKITVQSPNTENFQCASPKARRGATQGSQPMMPSMNLRQGGSMSVVQAQSGEVVATRRNPRDLEKSKTQVVVKELLMRNYPPSEVMEEVQRKLGEKTEAQIGSLNAKVEALIELVSSLKGEPRTHQVDNPPQREPSLEVSTSILTESPQTSAESSEPQPSTTKAKKATKKKKKTPAAEKPTDQTVVTPVAGSSSETKLSEGLEGSAQSDQTEPIRLKELLSMLNEHGLKISPNGAVQKGQPKQKRAQSQAKPSTS